MIRVTYLGHSGFLVETQEMYFLFDYYKGEFPRFDKDKKMLVFASHAHYDHYGKAIYGLREQFKNLSYILSSDIPVEEGDDVFRIGPCEEKVIAGCRIRTIRSNDQGVAFLVKDGEGHTFYHAGDLNWWHWEGEPDEYNKGMRRSYQAEINKLQPERIDAAFVPVDPRLGEQYCWGIDCFMKRTRTKYVFPMHFWENYSVCDRLMMEECTEEYRDRIVKIEREGQQFSLPE